MTPATGGSALGRLGEDAAGDWYLQHGCEIVQRNWSCRTGGIDLICRRGRVLVICEVKARTRTTHGHPLEAVTRAKQLRLRRLAGAYLRSQDRHWPEVRFDVASALGRTLHITEGAF